MQNVTDTLSRRSFLKKSTAAGASAFTVVKPELVRGAGKEKLKAGLIGCGGRGTEAVVNLLTGDPNVEFISMADNFEDRLERSLAEMRKARDPKVAERIKVPPDHHFVGFDAYEKVLKSDIDVVLLATPPGYRPIHFEAAIAAGKHVFCEKPFGTDPVGVRRFMDAARKSEEKKLTVVSGAQRRFSRDYQQTIDTIHNGAIGDVVATYAYWVGSPVLQFLGGGWPGPKGKRDPKWSDMVFQNRSWYSFVWICGDQVVEQHLHNIDVCNWVMQGHPVKVFASGGAVWRPRTEEYGNIYDHLDAEFEYANGVHMTSHCLQYPMGSYQNVSELAVGTKGRSNCHDLGASGQDVRAGFRDPLENPYVREHMALVSSIRGDGPYINHAMAVAESTMTCIMAREAAYSSQAITWDQIMASQLDLTPKAFNYDASVEAPPLPIPGQYKFM